MIFFQGWTYAVDFPATYHPQKQWSSCVRRRKWVRYRRYSAMNSWCAIAPLHKDPTKVFFRELFFLCYYYYFFFNLCYVEVFLPFQLLYKV